MSKNYGLCCISNLPVFFGYNTDVACSRFSIDNVRKDITMDERQIEYLIRSLGIGATYRGYRYLTYGIQLCLKDEDYLLSVSKLLYPQIAEHYCTTSYSVERDIRTVIKVCWDRGNKTLLQKIALRPLAAKPPSGEFFDILTAHLRQKSIPVI